MAHTPKNFDHLIAECKGFLSEAQLKAHFTLYQGYVKKLNEIEEKLGKADPTTANYSFSEYSELRRREPVAYNGTVLHEQYFANLGAPGQQVPESVKAQVPEPESVPSSFTQPKTLWEMTAVPPLR